MIAFDVPGAPDHELSRSDAAAVVGRMAAESGLLMFNFEHRVRLETPLDWLPPGRDDLGQVTGWTGGTLPESKYQAFRHDQLIGSFHPGHRAKWTAHELCHGLVGFAWKPGAPILFDALAARLAEAVPVALWYFFDEAGLRRCDAHHGGGPLFGAYCPACERAAREGPGEDGERELLLAEGNAFVTRELEAVLQSARRGRPVAHRLATLDLSSDGLAYAAAHHHRLRSPQMHRFVERFCPPGSGRHASLESLAARVEEITGAIATGRVAEPLRGDTWLWIARDVAWRLLTIHAECFGDAADALLEQVDTLADRPNRAGVEDAIAGYVALGDDFELPEPDDLLAVGYALPGGWGRSAAQVAEGVSSALPLTAAQLGEALVPTVRRFLADDHPRREPLGRRFAAWDGGDLARWEAAVAHPHPADPATLTLAVQPPDGAVTTADDVELLTFDTDVPALADALAAGTLPEPSGPTAWAVRRTAEGDVAAVPLSSETHARLATRTPFELEQLPEDERATLWEHGIVRAVKYAV